MATNQCQLPGFARDGQPRDDYLRRVPKRLSLQARPATLREHAVVEMPLLALISLIFAVSVMVAPGDRTRLVGLKLPPFFPHPFLDITHLPCLFCGMTRSFEAMGGLNVRQAFLFHPLGPVLYAAMLALGAVLSWSLAARRRIVVRINPVLRTRLIRLGVLLLLAAWPLKVYVWSRIGLL